MNDEIHRLTVAVILVLLLISQPGSFCIFHQNRFVSLLNLDILKT